MQIRYKDKKVRDLCEKRVVAEQKLGAACAGKLRRRLSDLEAAGRVSDLVAGGSCSLLPTTLRRPGQMAGLTGPK